jgi:hypothetical protein
MRGVRYIKPHGKWNKGKFKHWQHEANGVRLKFYFETQTGAVLQRLQWEHERTQLKRGKQVLAPELRDTLNNLLRNPYETGKR